jgi:hypothetical protein
MKRLTFCAALVVASIGLAGSASADSQGPINFESPYTVANIDGQQGWSKTGGYDVAVASVATFSNASGWGFGDQALRLSDSVTSGSFGDQTFSPGLTQPAGESDLSHFTATFKIGTTSATVQPGLHMSVSPDDGNGGRMSYLRFEDQSTPTDGVHVYFDDATDAGPVGTAATFSDTDIATLSRTTAHTVTFDIGFKTGAADLVNIYIDGSLKHSGTTWEDYYRYDPEQNGNGHAVPNTSKLLFREGGTANSGNAGGGFLVDGVSVTSSASAICTPTGFMRDNQNLTAAQIGGPVTGTLDALGCNIGVYYDSANGGSVSGADISGANYFGVLVNGTTVNVTNSSVHAIGEVPLNGSQHGNAIVYLNGAKGTISGNHVFNYQKNGITVSGVNANGTVPGPATSASVLNNVVTGEGHVAYIAQNGIQISYGASGTVTGNTVSGNWYTGPTYTACGLLFYQAGGVKQNANNLFNNQTNFCNFGRGGGKPPRP